MTMENEEDIFAGGVDIEIQLGKGKYFDSSSLSGGEQTLIALSLLFAIQEFKPYHFYVFDENRQLVYTGRGVDSPRDTSRMTLNDLDRALSELTEGKSISVPLTNPIGCNIKWDGKDAHWMPGDACDLV